MFEHARVSFGALKINAPNPSSGDSQACFLPCHGNDGLEMMEGQYLMSGYAGNLAGYELGVIFSGAAICDCFQGRKAHAHTTYPTYLEASSPNGDMQPLLAWTA